MTLVMWSVEELEREVPEGWRPDGYKNHNYPCLIKKTEFLWDYRYWEYSFVEDPNGEKLVEFLKNKKAHAEGCIMGLKKEIEEIERWLKVIDK